jgi:D-inositol-3-phosphate glycosyltransferase
MRIALYNLTTTTKIGGVESFVWDLGNQLVGRGHDVTIIGGHGARREPFGGRVETYPFVPRERIQALPLLRRAYAEAKLLERLSMAVTALPALLRGRYDIIHLQKPYDLGPALIARRLSGAKVILGCHGEDFYRGDRALARRVDAAVACSQFNAATVGARYPITPRVVFNGIDTQFFRRRPADTTLRARLGLAPDTRLILYVGRLQRWKGVDLIIRALAQLPQAALLIAGSGDDRARLETLTGELGLNGRVRFLGSVPRDDLPVLYSTADLLAAASTASETFGIGPVEAQACGLPVVASRFGGFPEAIADGVSGLLVTPGDVAALAAAIGRVLSDDQLRARLAAAGPGWAAQFGWPAVTDRIEAVYREVLCTS